MERLDTTTDYEPQQQRDVEIGVLHDADRVHYLNISRSFMNDEGMLTKELTPDFLHLSAAGYQVWADEVVMIVAACQAGLQQSTVRRAPCLIERVQQFIGRSRCVIYIQSFFHCDHPRSSRLARRR